MSGPIAIRSRVFFFVIVVALVAVLVGYVGAVPAHAALAESEPNDSTATADVVPLATTITGSSLIAGGTDYDYYAFDVTQRGRANLSFTFPAGLGTGTLYDVDVYNSAGSRLQEFDLDGSHADGAALSAAAVFLDVGRVYVRILSYSSRASWGVAYNLKLSVTPGFTETEFNDSTATADVVPLATTITGSSLIAGGTDYDYYAFSNAAPATASLSIKFPSTLGAGTAYTVMVLNSSGTKLYEFSLDASRWDGTWLAAQKLSLPAGTTYLRVNAYSSSPSWGMAYTLNLAYVVTSAPTPTISGTVTVGSTLTAVSGTWSPAGDSLTYQWKRNGTAITGATGKTYTLVETDGGTNITVTVTWKKAGYNTTTRTSAAKAVPALTFTTAPTPTISGTAAVGRTLTAVPGAWAPAPTSFVYQWKRNGSAISGATASTYGLVAADGGASITVTVTAKRVGYTSASKTSAAKVPTVSFTTAPTPTISGTATVGSTLTAVAGTWAPVPTSITYQWNRNGVAISGATASTYKLVAADGGASITVTVRATKAGYTSNSKTSAAKAVPALAFTAAPTPTITGTAAVGSTLTAVPGTWAPVADSLAYQWKRNGTAITGAAASTYALVAADGGASITVTVTATKVGYTTAAKTSAAKVPTSVFTTAPTPTITGTAAVGSTLTAVAGTWTPAADSLAYQWKRNGTAITGATASTYALVAADGGASITVTVTATKAGYITTAKTSAAMVPTSAFTTTPTPTITGTATVGSTLTAAPGTWSPAPDALTYQWKRNGTAITGATASTYKLVAADVGTSITVTVTAAKAGYTPTAKTSAAKAV